MATRTLRQQLQDIVDEDRDSLLAEIAEQALDDGGEDPLAYLRRVAKRGHYAWSERLGIRDRYDLYCLYFGDLDVWHDDYERNTPWWQRAMCPGPGGLVQYAIKGTAQGLIDLLDG